MSKAYSNKALPAGTILREWQLEDILGVGGFGIVYRGRGIYFGELVAIKEYFPSAISERDSEDTVVPIGSDVEEVHALGLKKFVEEAKLLWNLSTPTRHPNIVSVRSLFEVHGTAYMVMDFEDGISLSRYLKEGRRFNERSLWNIVRPIAEGLDRAHRVGVLHRDIKPPNILINEDSRPVLIDFGSARFEAADATSTTVTFHTPPYAAIEQYVKTYPQGPWTDIYALGVVLYECVTGEKPAEVLERLHGSVSKPLAEGHWPGFGKRFLQAIDAAMTIHPTERPQTIREWLALFGKKDVEDAAGDEDDAPTRFFAHEVAAKDILPVAPLAPGVNPKEPPETLVPTDPGEVEFKRVGEETGVSKRKKKRVATDDVAEPAKTEGKAPPASAKAEQAVSRPEKAGAVAKGVAKEPSKPWSKIPRAALFAGGALALVAVAGGALMLSGGDSGDEPVASLDAGTGPIAISDVGSLAPAARALAEEARTAGAPATAVNGLVAAVEQLDKQSAELQALRNDPAQAGAAARLTEDMKRIATSANVEFANAMLRDAEAQAQRLSPSASSSPAGARLAEALASLRSSAQASGNITDPGQSLGAARDALAKSQAFAAALPAAYRAQAASERTTDALPPPPSRTAITARPIAPVSNPVVATTETLSSAAETGVSPSKMAQFNGIIDSGRSMAKQVIQMGSGSRASQTRKANAQLARNYDKSLAVLKDSMRGVKSDREADRLIKQANQTKAYIVFLNKQSSVAE